MLTSILFGVFPSVPFSLASHFSCCCLLFLFFRRFSATLNDESSDFAVFKLKLFRELDLVDGMNECMRAFVFVGSNFVIDFCILSHVKVKPPTRSRVLFPVFFDKTLVLEKRGTTKKF